MSGLFAGLAGLAAVVLLALLYGRSARQLGRAEARRAEVRDVMATARQSGEIDEEVSGLADADLFDELHVRGADGMRMDAQDSGESGRSDNAPHGGTDRSP